MHCHLFYHIPHRQEVAATGLQVRLGDGDVVCSLYEHPSTARRAKLTKCSGGFIHLFFEGYFAYNFRAMGGRQDIFGQLWKEYSKSDSRYLTQDAFVLCMETITAVGYTLPDI
jgi:hypothetical protein